MKVLPVLIGTFNESGIPDPLPDLPDWVYPKDAVKLSVKLADEDSKESSGRLDFLPIKGVGVEIPGTQEDTRNK